MEHTNDNSWDYAGGRNCRCNDGTTPSPVDGSCFKACEWLKAEGETGIAPIDSTVRKTLAFEQSYLGNPLAQVALLGLAVYGAYHLTTKYLIKGKAK